MKKIIFGITAITIGIILGFVFQPLISGDNVYQQVKKFDKVLQISVKNYVEKVDTPALVEAAIKGMLEELDPHSIYISAEQRKKVKEDLLESSFEGIGVEFDIINDTITVISPIPGGPSDELGILSGDKIINIDDETAVAIDRSNVPKRLRGPKGTKVKVDIKRLGEPELLNFVITRDKIPLNSVEASFIVNDSDIGLISVSKFSSTTHEELVSAIDKLKKNGMKKLILDLRGNGGGLLRQAFLLADEFLPEGDTIVYTKGRKKHFDEVYFSSSRGMSDDLPLIVLIDAGSASASEIVSGAIQDLDRGLILGLTSFGKGLVQRPYELFDGSAFRLTISKYYTPSGRSIQRKYEDKMGYRMLDGWLDLKEGGNIERTLDNLKEQINRKKMLKFLL